MKKVYTALLLILLAAMFSVGVYSLADYDATGSVSEKREFVKPEFSVKSLLDGTYISALRRYSPFSIYFCQLSSFGLLFPVCACTGGCK